MSWITRNYRSESWEFHMRRERAEGFVKPFVQPRPQYLLLKTLAAYPLRGEGFFYMRNLRDYTELLLIATRDVANAEGWASVYDFAIRMRRAGLVKDPPLVSAQIWPDKAQMKELLKLYPLPKMLLFLEIAKKGRKDFGWSYGARKKDAVVDALKELPFEWHELQAIKYPTTYRDILRMLHPKPWDDSINRLWRWVVKKGDAPTDKTKAYEEAVRASTPADAVKRAIEADLPWEVIRSRIGKLDAIPNELLFNAAAKLMGPFDLAMQAGILTERLGKDQVEYLVRRRGRIPLSAGARAAIGLAVQGRLEVANAFFEKVQLGREEFNKLLPAAPKRVISLIDVSGSMQGARILAAARVLLPFTKVFEKAYVFNSGIEGIIKQIQLSTLNDYLGLLNMPDDGTPLYDAIQKTITEERLGEDDLLFVLTDEQENASKAPITALSNIKTWVVLGVVAPYPADMILKNPETRAIAYPASDPDSFIASAQLVTAKKLIESEGVVEITKLLPPIALQAV